MQGKIFMERDTSNRFMHREGKFGYGNGIWVSERKESEADQYVCNSYVPGIDIRRMLMYTVILHSHFMSKF